MNLSIVLKTIFLWMLIISFVNCADQLSHQEQSVEQSNHQKLPKDLSFEEHLKKYKKHAIKAQNKGLFGGFRNKEKHSILADEYKAAAQRKIDQEPEDDFGLKLYCMNVDLDFAKRLSTKLQAGGGFFDKSTLDYELFEFELFSLIRTVF